MTLNDLTYWNNFYKTDVKLNKNSNFASLIKNKFLKKKMEVLEIGTGNGRDAFYFSNYVKSIIAIDQSKTIINENKSKLKKLKIKNLHFYKCSVNQIKKIKKKNSFSFIYARFFLHSINAKKEDLLLKNLSKYNKINPLIAFEFRTDLDKLMKRGKKLSKFERYTDHYRRFINVPSFEKKLSNYGFKIVYKKTGINLSKTKNDNPHLCRIIFCKI